MRRGFAFTWSVLGVGITGLVIYFTFKDLNLKNLLTLASQSEWRWLTLLFIAAPLEQIVRAWKWRQLLFDVRPVNTGLLFGAVMAGYFVNMIVPVGISPLVRSWVVARHETLRISTVLVTTVIERLVDGVVFAIIVSGMLILLPLPNQEEFRLGLGAVAIGSFALFGGLLLFLKRLRFELQREGSIWRNLFSKLERRFSRLFGGLSEGVHIGIVWPSSNIRGGYIVLASFVMKGISATQMFFAGLTVGVILQPMEYVFVMVFTAFSMILTRFIRIPAGGVIGAALSLKLLDVPSEQALVMVAYVHTMSMFSTALFGVPSLWYSGLKLSEIRQID